MAKTKQPRKSTQQNSFLSNFSLNDILPEKYHIPVIMGILVILFLIFLKPLFFDGKTFESGDIVASESAQSYLQKARDGFTLWNPHIFCGMPAYSLAVGFTWFNLIYVAITEIRNVFTAFFAVDYVKWAFYLIILAFTSFFLMRHLVKDTLISLFTAIATSFSTGIIVFLYIGHVTKLTSLCMFPLVFLMLLRMQQKIKLLDFFILVISLQLMVQGFHVQIIFYLLMFIGLYYAYYLIRSIITKESELRNNLLKSLGLLVAGVGIALAIQSDSLTQIYEYTPYSTRGTKGAVEMAAGESDKSQSDYYAYHTDWSFSPGEVMTFVIPSFYGFGYSTYNGALTQNEDYIVNTYFGQMRFVDVAMYMGVLVFFLALFAIITRFREPLVQLLTLVAGFALLLSFGRTFPVLFDLLFYHLPYFDKFRVPSMSLVIVQITLPILAGLGIEKIVKLKDETDTFAVTILKIGSGVFAVLFIGTLLLNQVLVDWFTARVQETAHAENLRPLFEYMGGMFTGDMLFAFAATACLFLLGFAAYNKKVSSHFFVSVIIILTIVDLWRIDARGIKYTEAPQKGSLFTEPDYVRSIKGFQDKDPFRILNLKQDNSLGSIGQNSNFNAYFLLEDFFGYSAIKPRAYQDMMDVVGYANPTLWSIANVKYLILEKPYQIPGAEIISENGKTYIYKNLNNLGRYYFVSSLEKKSAMDVLQAIKNNSFNPSQVAYTDEAAPKVDPIDSTASVQVKVYKDELSELSVNAPGNNFLVFAATYHPKGWKAKVDGVETKIFRANHAFMGIVVPKGKHNVTFEYAPDSFYLARTVSLVLSSLTFIGLFIGIFLERKNRRE